MQVQTRDRDLNDDPDRTIYLNPDDNDGARTWISTNHTHGAANFGFAYLRKTECRRLAQARMYVADSLEEE